VTSSGISLPPGPGFVASLAAATGIHRTPAYDLAQLLITHPGPRRANETNETVEDGMRHLAAALNLGPGAEPPPVVGARIVVRPGIAALDYGHDRYVMTLPVPSPSWLRLLTYGGPCRICLVFAPLALGAGRSQTDTHLRENFARGAVVWGTAYARHRF
jgi:hypothetical protein